jgi:hypothetical protein
LCLSGCSTPTPDGSARAAVTLTNRGDTLQIPTITGWRLYGPPRSPVHVVSFVPIVDPNADFAHQLPMSAITFELLPVGTGRAEVMADAALRGSVPLPVAQVSVGDAQYTLECRRGDMVDSCFVMVPLRESVFVASLTVARGPSGDKYFLSFEKQFRETLSRLVLPERSNQAMQPTTGRRTPKFLVTQTSDPAATRALASGG